MSMPCDTTRANLRSCSTQTDGIPTIVHTHTPRLQNNRRRPRPRTLLGRTATNAFNSHNPDATNQSTFEQLQVPSIEDHDRDDNVFFPARYDDEQVPLYDADDAFDSGIAGPAAEGGNLTLDDLDTIVPPGGRPLLQPDGTYILIIRRNEGTTQELEAMQQRNWQSQPQDDVRTPADIAAEILKASDQINCDGSCIGNLQKLFPGHPYVCSCPARDSEGLMTSSMVDRYKFQQIRNRCERTEEEVRNVTREFDQTRDELRARTAQLEWAQSEADRLRRSPFGCTASCHARRAAFVADTLDLRIENERLRGELEVERRRNLEGHRPFADQWLSRHGLGSSRGELTRRGG